MRRPYHGGQNAREWRRKVAALAHKQDESVARRQRKSVFTYKFGLETEPGDIDFDAAAHAYDITEGIEKGSLIGLVCAVHLSGFRLFSKGYETRQFRNPSRYPESAFADALRTHAKIVNPKLTIQSIEDVFANPPRKSEGVAPIWSADNLARRLFQSWEGRSPRDGDSASPTFLFANGIAGVVAKSFEDWRELADNVPGALACADKHLTSLGGDAFPELGSLPPPKTDFQPKSCTFAYDAESPFVCMNGNEGIRLHQTVAVCAARLKRDGGDLSPSQFQARLKDAVVTYKNNGLSWLFGKGLRYLRESDAERIVKDLSVPHVEFRRVEQLKAFADAVPANPFFETDGYAEFRSSVGGKISSWVSNYWKRVRELEELHRQPPSIIIPDELLHAENRSLFSGQHSDATGLKALAERIPARIGDAGCALAVLSGDGIPGSEHIDAVERVADGIPGSEHIDAVERVADGMVEIMGQIAMLNNRIDQEVERAKDEQDEDRVEKLEALRPRLSEQLKEPPKLNRISGGTADAAEEIERLEDELNAAVRERRDHFRRLAAWAEDNAAALDPLPVMAERERRALTDRNEDPALADEKALRRLLHSIVGMSRRLSPDTAKLVRDAIAPLFWQKKEANRYFHNRQGAIYRHPFSTSRHQEYAIDIDRARKTDWPAWLDGRASDIRKKLNTDAAPALLRDLFAIEGFVFTHRLGGLPDRIPAEPAKLQIDGDLVRVPPLLAAQLDADEVSRDVAVRAFNLFNGAINGLSFRAFRDDFIVRAKFQRNGCDELFYAPKDRAWRPPGDYRSAKGDISKGLDLPAVVRDQAGAILPCETAQGLSDAEFPEPGSRALLRQAPHDWLVELNLRNGAAPNRAGLPVEQQIETGWRRLKRPAFRLVGPPSFKTWLDRILVNEKVKREVKLGDYTLILDRPYKQSLKVEGEEIRLAVEPAEVRAEIAVPVIDDRPYPDKTDNLLFDNVVAIDLGEKRVGFAVFSLVDLLEKGACDAVVDDDGKPVVGAVAIPAFRRLMAAVRRHRGSKQPNQKVGQTYSKALMRFRENVIGDVCNRIDTLCERFRAFPILESSIGNFEAGGRQLEMIYGSVLRRYTYSKVDAHKAARRHYWFTAEQWQHPYIRVHGWSQATKKYSGRSKTLKIFPGVTVNPAGTSRTCHRCRRNALAALRKMTDRIDVGKNGEIVLEDGTARLLERADYPPSERKKFRRRNERPPLNAPVRQGSHKRDDLERIAKRNMRQAPLSEMSPDTTQARFVCVYTDCGFEGHADANAAVNIGRRFLEERIDVKRSKKARRDLTVEPG